VSIDQIDNKHNYLLQDVLALVGYLDGNVFEVAFALIYLLVTHLDLESQLACSHYLESAGLVVSLRELDAARRK
jgi:hypothetical protein